MITFIIKTSNLFKFSMIFIPNQNNYNAIIKKKSKNRLKLKIKQFKKFIKLTKLTQNTHPFHPHIICVDS